MIDLRELEIKNRRLLNSEYQLYLDKLIIKYIDTLDDEYITELGYTDKELTWKILKQFFSWVLINEDMSK